MSVSELIVKFVALGKSYAGCGPDHPTKPNLKLRPVFDAFVAKYPVLLRDDGYVEFLRLHAGASIDIRDERGDNLWVAWLIGLDHFGGEVVAFSEDGYSPELDGFVCAAQIYHQRLQIDINFGFDLAATARSGIHRIVAKKGIEVSRSWYRDTFIEWLERFVKVGENIFLEV